MSDPLSIESATQPVSRLDGAEEPAPSIGRLDTGPMVDLIKRLPRYARITAALARDPHVPPRSKAMLGAGALYLVSPIDLVPGIIPVAGQIDDLYVVLTGLQQAIRACPAPVIERHFAAVGLAPAIVDEDLAAIRAFVRDGVAWSLRQGGRMVNSLAHRAAALTSRARQGAQNHDQEPV
jgi:uncharacterized membrane protein YkvA (DUF1232 family)